MGGGGGGRGDKGGKVSRVRGWTMLLSSAGLALALYALYVEIAKAKDPSYQALCDISEHISCSKVFISKYGTGLGIVGGIFGDDSILNQPNGLYGVFMYPLFFLTCLSGNLKVALIQLGMGVAGLLISLYLGYILFIVLEDICVVCIANYVVNILLFICSFVNYTRIRRAQTERREMKKMTGSSSASDGRTKVD